MACLSKRYGGWVAAVRHGGTRHYLGYNHPTKEIAVEVENKFREAHGIEIVEEKPEPEVVDEFLAYAMGVSWVLEPRELILHGSR